MRLPILRPLAQTPQTPEIPNDILGLAKVHLLQQVPHLELHVLDEAADVGDVRLVGLDGELLLDLARHVAAEVDGVGAGGGVGEGEDDGRGELVVGCAAALDCFEDVDGVPDAVGGSARGGGCGCG